MGTGWDGMGWGWGWNGDRDGMGMEWGWDGDGDGCQPSWHCVSLAAVTTGLGELLAAEPTAADGNP